MELKKSIETLETRRLVYAKFLFLQGKKFLENQVVESYFNLSVVLFANSIEIVGQTLAWCIEGEDRSQEKVSDLLKSLNKKLVGFPHNEFDKAIKARNAIYHSGTMHTYGSCKDIEHVTEQGLMTVLKNYLNLEYAGLSLTQLLNDQQVAIPLRRSEEFISNGDYHESVRSACEAFAMLKYRVNHRAHQQIRKRDIGILFGTEISWDNTVARIMSPPKGPGLQLLSRHIEEQVNKKILNLAHEIDFNIMLGPLYEDYKHFRSIAPIFDVILDGSVHFSERGDELQRYKKEDAEFTFSFVLRCALDIEPKLKPIEVRDLAGNVIEIIK